MVQNDSVAKLLVPTLVNIIRTSQECRTSISRPNLTEKTRGARGANAWSPCKSNILIIVRICMSGVGSRIRQRSKLECSKGWKAINTASKLKPRTVVGRCEVSSDIYIICK